jgi:hypothetical protein
MHFGIIIKLIVGINTRLFMNSKNKVAAGGAVGFLIGCIYGGFILNTYTSDIGSIILAALPVGIFLGLIGLVIGWLISLFTKN